LTVASSSEKHPTAATMKPTAASGIWEAGRDGVRRSPAAGDPRHGAIADGRRLERVKGIEPSS
jgi:hypothetical protein